MNTNIYQQLFKLLCVLVVKNMSIFLNATENQFDFSRISAENPIGCWVVNVLSRVQVIWNLTLCCKCASTCT